MGQDRSLIAESQVGVDPELGPLRFDGCQEEAPLSRRSPVGRHVQLGSQQGLDVAVGSRGRVGE